MININMELIKQINKTNLQDVIAKYNLKIIEDKEYPDLYLLKYPYDSELKDNKLVKECRGIILEKDTNKIISYGLNKTDNIELISKEDLDTYIIEEAIDGTQIRIVHYKDKWLISTARCIDAYKSKWNYVKSYGLLFDDVKDKINFSLLNKNYTYTFILKHVENRIIEKITKNDLYHIHTRDNISLLDIDEDINIKKPKIYKFNSLEEVTNELNILTFNNMGYVIKNKDVKFMLKSTEYLKIRELKGNNFNIKYLYLELKKKDNLITFLEYFPEYDDYFKNIEINILNLSKELHKLYIKKFIEKEKIGTIDKLQYHLLYNIHKEYLNNKTKTTVNKIYDLIHNQSVGLIIKLL